MAGQRYSFVPPGGGRGYDWNKDYTFVKVSPADTGGAFAPMEDNLKLEFALGLHLHRQHAETCYILDGEINFYIDGDWMAAAPGRVSIYLQACRTRLICRRAAQAGCS